MAKHVKPRLAAEVAASWRRDEEIPKARVRHATWAACAPFGLRWTACCWL